MIAESPQRSTSQPSCMSRVNDECLYMIRRWENEKKIDLEFGFALPVMNAAARHYPYPVDEEALVSEIKKYHAPDYQPDPIVFRNNLKSLRSQLKKLGWNIFTLDRECKYVFAPENRHPSGDSSIVLHEPIVHTQEHKRALICTTLLYDRTSSKPDNLKRILHINALHIAQTCAAYQLGAQIPETIFYEGLVHTNRNTLKINVYQHIESINDLLTWMRLPYRITSNFKPHIRGNKSSKWKVFEAGEDTLLYRTIKVD